MSSTREKRVRDEARFCEFVMQERARERGELPGPAHANLPKLETFAADASERAFHIAGGAE